MLSSRWSHPTRAEKPVESSWRKLPSRHMARFLELLCSLYGSHQDRHWREVGIQCCVATRLEGDGIYALAGCTDPKYFDPQTYTSNFSQKGCGPKVTRTQIMVVMSNGTYVAEAMQNIQQHYPHMLPQLYPSNLQRGWSGPAVFPSEIAAGQLVSLNLSLHSAYHADNKLALAQVFSNSADVDVSKLELCEDIQFSEELLQAYVAVTGDRDGGFHSSDTASPGGYSGLRPVAAPATPRASLLCIPKQHTAQWWRWCRKRPFGTYPWL